MTVYTGIYIQVLVAFYKRTANFEGVVIGKRYVWVIAQIKKSLIYQFKTH